MSLEEKIPDDILKNILYPYLKEENKPIFLKINNKLINLNKIDSISDLGNCCEITLNGKSYGYVNSKKYDLIASMLNIVDLDK